MYTARNIENEKPETTQQNSLDESTAWSEASNSSVEMWGSTSNEHKYTTSVKRGDNLLRELRMDLPKINRFIYPKSAPWERNLIPVDKTLLQEVKQGKSQEEIRRLFIQRKNTKHRMSTGLYTDGSKREKRCGYSVVCGEVIIRKRISGMSSIFTAESLAIMDAVLWILDQPHGKDVVIFTDSLSATSALERRKINSKWRDEMSVLYKKLQIKQIALHICWVPSHVGIPGNEKADEQAKLALLETVTQTNEVDYKEIKTQIKNKIIERWQTQWHNAKDKLREVKNTVRKYRFSSTDSRKDDVIMARLRIGHTQLTHKYLLEKEEETKCRTCNAKLTVKHILVQCPGLEEERKKVNLPTSLREILADDEGRISQVLEFLKNTGYYGQI